jgi:hypothetical protein
MNGNSGFVPTLAMSAIVLGFALRADSSTVADSASRWAGAYHYHQPNSTMSLRLVITPESRFSLSMGGCFGSPQINHGRVVFRNGAVVLDPALPVEQGFTYESRIMIPMRLGGRLYLVGTDRVAEFAAAVAAGSEPCGEYCSNFFVRESEI